MTLSYSLKCINETFYSQISAHQTMVELQATWMAFIYTGFWFSKSSYDYLFGRRSFSSRKLGVANKGKR